MSLRNLDSQSPLRSQSNVPQIQLNGSAQLKNSQLSDETYSLNDDLSERSKNRDQMRDSISLRRSSFDSTFNATLIGTHTVKHGIDYSPLVDNSIYEIVLNTRFKRWLKHPSVEDIPPVTLPRSEVKNDWESYVEQYANLIQDEYKVYQKTNNISTLRRMSTIRNVDDSTDEFTGLKKAGNAFNEVPAFYFEKDFKLDDPSFFRRIIEDFELDTILLLNGEDSLRTSSYEDVQAKLNFYLDTVETLLVSDISKSTHKFFDALEDVDKIKKHAEDTVRELDAVSKDLTFICDSKIRNRIDVLKNLIRRKNVEKLQQGLLQVNLILDKCKDCKQSNADGTPEKTLKLLRGIEALILGDNSNECVDEWTSQWPYKLKDVSHLPALKSKREFLETLKIELGGYYSLQLSNLLLDDLREYALSQPKNDTITKLQKRKDKSKAHLVIETSLRDSLKHYVDQLVDCGELVQAFKMFEEKFITELKGIIKTNLPRERESSDQVSQGTSGGSKLSKLIQDQSYNEFEEMLISIFAKEIEVLRRLTRHQKLLLDISLNELEFTSDQSEKMIIDLDIRKSINEGIRIIQLRMGKIISVRRDINISLRFDEFVRFYQICLLFMKECESISGEFLTKYLSDVVGVQIDAYLKSLQNQSINVIKQKVEQDKWTPYIVEPQLQKDVNNIVSCIDVENSSLSKTADLTIPCSQQTDSPPPEDKRAGHKKSVVVGDKTFVASESLVVAINTIKTLLVLAINLPSQYSRACEKQLVDFIKYFNAKAIESVTSSLTDKPITKTDKNLSIMAESLDCLAEIILILQELFQKISGSNPDRYQTVWKQLQQSSEKLFQTMSLPPPV